MTKYLLSLILFLAFSFSLAQERTIQGVVEDASDNSGLPGVTILIEGTSGGTTTDLDGKYTIQVKKGDVLVFQMVGMETVRLTLGDQQILNVSLRTASTLLDAVVVNGFQEVDRKLFTGAATSLQMKQIEIKGEPDIGRMLEGQVAGVSVDNVSGTFGSAPKIRIRGNTSINGNNQPLIVVDGVILEDLSDVNTEDFISGNANTLVSSSIANLNPNDIESYQVLKDASATAIYGARAANGVIVITTKRGTSGELQVGYSGNFSVKLRPTYNQFDLLNSAEEMSVYRELVDKGVIDISTSVRSKNYGAMGKMFTLIANHELDWGPGGTLNENFLNQYENANTDWFDVLFNDLGFQQQHSLSFTTGTEKSNNYYSVSYFGDQGQTIADEVQRITATARNTYFISEAFTFGLKFNGSYRDQTVPGTRNRELDPLTGRFNRDFDINPLSYALNTARSIRPYDENGNLEFFRRNYAPFNILQELDLNSIDIQVVDLSVQTDFEVIPFDDFSLKGVIQGRFANTKRDHMVHERSNQAEAFRAADTQFIQEANNLLYNDPDNPGLNPVSVLPVGGFNYVDQTDLLNLFGRVSGEWSKAITENHIVNVLGGGELRFSDRTSTSTTGLGVVYESGGIVVTDPNIIEFFNSQNIDYYSLSESKDRFVGLFLNGAYAYKSRYIANFTVRYDGSNQLGNSDQARYLPTWNVSAAWNLDQEPFMSGVDFLSYFKLRGTYGLSGNLPPESSALLNIVADVTVRPTDVEPALLIQDLTNTELTWEKLKELNVGIDAGFLNDRINTSIDYFNRQSFDLIGLVQNSGVGGQAVKFGNFADMESNGFEAAISTVNIQNNDFTWTTNFNIGYAKDQITNLDFGPRPADALSQGGAAVLGGPRRGLFSANFAGLTGQGIPTFFNASGEQVLNLDLQERNNLSETYKFEGPIEPRGAGGFTNTLRYKGFSLMVLLTYKFDYKIRLNDAFFSSYTDFDALPGDLADRWAVPGDEQLTNIPVILDQGFSQSNSFVNQAYDLYNKSTLRVADGDYIRLKTIRLSYQLPVDLVTRMKMKSLGLSLETNNIALLYSDDDLNGQDPEFFTSGGVALPPPRTITLALSIGL